MSDKKFYPVISCLDHGFVRLIDHMGNDLSIVRAARVSYNAAWRSGTDTGSDARLLRRLWADRHTTPFEAVEFQFEVKAPIFVFRQWHRHRTWSYNELSARYRELPEEFYVPDATQVGSQSTINKQGRILGSEEELLARHEEVETYRHRCEMAFRDYKWLLEQGWPRELARGVLPTATYSHMFGKTNLLNLSRFLELRLDPHAQYEIRVYAEAMLSLIQPIVPEFVEAFTQGINGKEARVEDARRAGRKEIIERLREINKGHLEDLYDIVSLLEDEFEFAHKKDE